MLKVDLIAHTPEPERVVAAAAKLCYSAVGVDKLMEDLTPEKSAKFLKMLSNLGHASPTEHASFTFAIEVCPGRCWRRSPATALPPIPSRASAMSG